jgi:hypothetical protein
MACARVLILRAVSPIRSGALFSPDSLPLHDRFSGRITAGA